jgi:hypothetical protein
VRHEPTFAVVVATAELPERVPKVEGKVAGNTSEGAANAAATEPPTVAVVPREPPTVAVVITALTSRPFQKLGAAGPPSVVLEDGPAGSN